MPVKNHVSNQCPRCKWPIAPQGWVGGVCKICWNEIKGLKAPSTVATNASVTLCDGCDLMLPSGSPPGRCDRCEFEYVRTKAAETVARERASDTVNHPVHYNVGDIECIDAIESALGPEGFRAYCRGNALKYIWRATHKGKFAEDIRKAIWYLNRSIQEGDKQ